MRHTWMLLALLFAAAGCANFRESRLNPANTEVTVRSEPVVQFSVVPGEPMASPFEGVTVRCIATREQQYRDAPKLSQCMYMSADITKIKLDSDKKMRNQVLSYLLNLSDHNCATFMARAFATKAGVEATRGTLKDLMTGLSAALAAHAPGPSSVLGLANLAFGSSVDNFDRNYYVDKTFTAMENAIQAERSRIRADIAQNKLRDITDNVTDPKKPVAGYTLSDALADVAEYDQACSIPRGIRKLSELSGTEKKQQENNVDKAEGRKTDTELAAASKKDEADAVSGIAADRAKKELDQQAKGDELAQREKKLKAAEDELKAKEAAANTNKKKPPKN